MKVMIRGFLMLMVLGLAGCSYFSNAGVMQAQDSNYLSARTAPPLRVPPGVSTTTFTSDYPVSDRTYPVSQLKVDLTPPGL